MARCGSPTAAVAEPPDQSGVVVLEGPPIEEGCLGEGFDEFTETVVNTPAGVVAGTSTHTDQVCVFDDEGFEDPLDWLLGGGMSSGESRPVCPEPLAHGEGRVSVNTRVEWTVASTSVCV